MDNEEEKINSRNKWRVEKKSKGLCTNCGKVPHKPGRINCQGCIDKAADKVAARRSDKTVKRCQTCGKISGAKYCDVCLEKSRKNSKNPKYKEQRKRYAAQRAKDFKKRNVCPMCGKPKFGDRYYCERHWLEDISCAALGTTKYWREVKNIFVQQNGKCYYTGDAITLESTASIEHKNSKHNHGKNAKEITNLAWCRLDVNIMKSKKDELDFIALCKKIGSNASGRAVQ